MNKQFAVIGLGRFGSSVARALYDMNHDVMAIDIDEEKIQNNLNNVTHAVQADTTDEATLKSLGVSNFDVIVVAIGENIQASTLTTLILKELGVDKVVVKAQNQLHAKVLYKIGATRVIFPERDMGIRVAHNLVSDNILDYIELSNEYSIAEVLTSEKMQGQNLVDLNIRAKYNCNIIALKNTDYMNVAPNADDVIREGDIMVVIGHNKALKKFEDYVVDEK